MINQQGHEAWRGIKQGFAEGVLKSVPIVIGYLPVAVAFGLISTQSGLSLYHTVLMSVMVYAGASQFMAVSMLAGGVGAMEIILATFILNFRHFIMSLSLMNGIKSVPNQWKWVLSSWITDETFSVASFHKEKAGPGFLAGLMLTAYGSWILAPCRARSSGILFRRSSGKACPLLCMPCSSGCWCHPCGRTGESG